MGHDYQYLSFNAVNWALWTRLHELTAGAGSSLLTQALRELTPPRIRDASEEQTLRHIAATFEETDPVLHPMHAAMALRVDQQRFAPRLAALFADADDDHRAYVREEIVQLAFPDGGHRMWGHHEIREPLLLLAAIIPPFRDEFTPDDLSSGWVRADDNEDEPILRTSTELYDQPMARALGLVLPLPPRPVWPFASRTLSPAEAATLASQLPPIWEVDDSEDPEFFAMVEHVRPPYEEADAGERTLIDDLREDLGTISRVFADCAARRLGLDVYYHTNP